MHFEEYGTDIRRTALPQMTIFLYSCTVQEGLSTTEYMLISMQCHYPCCKICHVFVLEKYHLIIHLTFTMKT